METTFEPRESDEKRSPIQRLKMTRKAQFLDKIEVWEGMKIVIILGLIEDV